MTEHKNRRTWALAQLGRTLGGRYRIDALRGTGGMGAVFEGTHLHVDRRVAIKLLFPESSSDAEALQREAKHAASIPGHGVVAITDFDFTEEGAFLVMELLEGRSLAERLRDGPLSEAETRALVGDVLETLHAVHEAGLVHGDLKPSNVFLADDGTTKLLDFGVARSIGNEDGRVRGTPAYMAPEQLKGAVDPRIDVYAVGALAYEALSAQRPYADRDSPSAVIEALEAGPPEALSRLTDRADASCAWVERAMARNPEDRFASALAMLDAVDALPDHAGPDHAGPDHAGPDHAGPDHVPKPAGSTTPDAASAFRAAVQAPPLASAPPSRARRALWLLLPLGALLAGLGYLAWPDPAPAPDRVLSPPTPEASPPRPAPLPIGARVVAPYGPRFHFPGTVVADNGDAVRVVFADGDVTTIPRVDVQPDRLVPGACVLRRRQRTGVRACITQRVQHAVRVTSPEGAPGWTSVMHLFLDPAEPSPGVVPYEAPEPPAGVGPGALVWARFRNGAEDFAGVVVEAGRDPASEDGVARSRVVYFDGDTEWLGEDAVRPFALPAGTAVRAAPRRTAMVDPDVGPATVRERVGDAVHVELADGRRAWVALGQIAVPHP